MATELKKLTKALKRINVPFRKWGLRHVGDDEKEITLDPPGTYLLLEEDSGVYAGFSFDADGQLLSVEIDVEEVTG